MKRPRPRRGFRRSPRRSTCSTIPPGGASTISSWPGRRASSRTARRRRGSICSAASRRFARSSIRRRPRTSIEPLGRTPRAPSPGTIWRMACRGKRHWLSRAREAILKACDLDPMNAVYLRLAGEIFADSGMNRRAQIYYQKALTWGGDDPAIRSALDRLGNAGTRRREPFRPRKLTMRLRACGLSDVGRSRSHNEDHFEIVGDGRLCVVADGMGGHGHGDMASRIAVEAILEHVGDDPRRDGRGRSARRGPAARGARSTTPTASCSKRSPPTRSCSAWAPPRW